MFPQNVFWNNVKRNFTLALLASKPWVYHLFQAGFPNTVAIFGSALSDEQAEILIATGRPIILLFDGDDAGRSGMESAASWVA